MKQTHSLLGFSVDAMKSHIFMACTLLHFSRHLRQCQIAQIDASRQEVADMLRQLDGVDNADQLRQASSEMLGVQVERVGAYWNSLGQQWAADQTELSQQFQSLYDKSAAHLCQDVVQLQSALIQESSTALQPLFESGIYFSGDAGDSRRNGHGGTNGTGVVLSGP